MFDMWRYGMEGKSIIADNEATGIVEVEHVAGKSVITRSFSKYPLKLIVPLKVASSVDVVWIYTVSYGGGFVSGDSVSIKAKIGMSCTTVFTTQASTKVYKSTGGQVSKQLLEVSVENEATVMVLPDPVTCFSAAKYEQFQAIYLAKMANVVLVDWCTSGRRDRGEVWCFDYYRSSNHIFLEGHPLFLDSMCLENEEESAILNRMQHFQVVAMVIIYGPKLQNLCLELKKSIQLLNQTDVRSASRGKLSGGTSGNSSNHNLLASCSTFGPKEDGLVVRIVSDATEHVYQFLRHHLASLQVLVGVIPYVGK